MSMKIETICRNDAGQVIAEVYLTKEQREKAERLINSVAEILAPLDYNRTFLTKLGFKKVPTNWCSSNYFYKNEKLGVVVKYPYLHKESFENKMKIPSVVVKNPRYKKNPYKIGWFVVIQPLANTEESENAFADISRHGWHIPDFHHDNCAHYEGVSVLIDW